MWGSAGVETIRFNQCGVIKVLMIYRHMFLLVGEDEIFGEVSSSDEDEDEKDVNVDVDVDSEDETTRGADADNTMHSADFSQTGDNTNMSDSGDVSKYSMYK